jgi:hypothetical protein
MGAMLDFLRAEEPLSRTERRRVRDSAAAVTAAGCGTMPVTVSLDQIPLDRVAVHAQPAFTTSFEVRRARRCLSDPARWVESVHGFDQADRAGAGQVVKCDARRNAALESSCEVVYDLQILNDRGFSGRILMGRLRGSVCEFHFGPSCPSCSGHPSDRETAPEATRVEGDHPLAFFWRAERSGGLHEMKRSGVEEAWDTRVAQVGRQAVKRRVARTRGQEGSM